jgi:4-oxalocrotonate tautomerase
MSGNLPDARRGGRVDHASNQTRPDQEDNMPLIQVKVIEGVFTTPQKQEIVERLTETMVEIEGENLRPATWCVLEEVKSGDWAIGGHALTTDDVKALARGEAVPS